MKQLLLMFIILLSTHTNQAMEQMIPAEGIHLFFTEKRHPHLALMLPRHDQGLTALLECGVKKNDIEFITWLLHTKKPLFDSAPVQKALALAHDDKKNQIATHLESYIAQEKQQRQEELELYKTEQTEKIEKLLKAEALFAAKTETKSQCRCIIL